MFFFTQHTGIPAVRNYNFLSTTWSKKEFGLICYMMYTFICPATSSPKPRTADWPDRSVRQKKKREGCSGGSGGGHRYSGEVSPSPFVFGERTIIPLYMADTLTHYYSWQLFVRFCSGIACILQHLEPCPAKMIQPGEDRELKNCFWLTRKRTPSYSNSKHRPNAALLHVYINKAALCLTKWAVTQQQ